MNTHFFFVLSSLFSWSWSDGWVALHCCWCLVSCLSLLLLASTTIPFSFKKVIINYKWKMCVLYLAWNKTNNWKMITIFHDVLVWYAFVLWLCARCLCSLFNFRLSEFQFQDPFVLLTQIKSFIGCLLFCCIYEYVGASNTFWLNST